MIKFRAICLGLATYFLSSLTVHAQTLTEEEKMQWFVDRLPLGAVYGAVAGTIATLLWLRRVKYLPENLSLDPQVRHRFLVALILSLMVLAAVVWLDLWLFSTSETIIQGPFEALFETLSFPTVVLMSIATATFYIASLLWTRGAFSGRYALWPGPKPQ